MRYLTLAADYVDSPLRVDALDAEGMAFVDLIVEVLGDAKVRYFSEEHLRFLR